MKPTVGRIVHARHLGGRPCYAAVVVSVWENSTWEAVSLCVLRPDGFEFPSPAGREDLVPSGKKARPYTWHWPEREE